MCEGKSRNLEIGVKQIEAGYIRTGYIEAGYICSLNWNKILFSD